MSHPNLFPTATTPRKIILEMDDLTLDLVDGVRATLHVVMDGGQRVTVMSRVLQGDAAADFPPTMVALGEAFLWGDGLAALVHWAQQWDRSAQSRRVRDGATRIG